HRALSEHKTLSISWSHYPDASIKDIEVLTTLFFNADFINVPLLIVLNSEVILRREISGCK
ncbi:hypothetical protein, partial [Escherichia coli]|uniref:hypothetical protein n=1 Tax=Escherichia coli TaxID=562 RepID=UPI001CDAFBF5